MRALAPSPGAWTEVGGVLITVVEAREALDYPAILLPGEAVCDGDRCVVRSGDGAVEIVRVEVDGQRAPLSELRVLMESAARCGPVSG